MFRRFYILGLALVVFAATGQLRPALASPWGQGYLPNVPVVDQNGRELRFYDDVVKGKIVVISFIYTSCRDICPVVTARMAQVQDKLGDLIGRDIFFVSISIDPANDTPEKLKAYAEAFGANSSWSFLTGKAEDLNVLRYKLGERSRKLAEHGNTIMLFNDVTSEWSRDSAFSDLNVLAANIKTMNPAWSTSRSADPLASKIQPTQQTSISPDMPGQSLYVKTCAACHTVGKGAKVGPDLSGVTTRRSRDWVVDYLVDPAKMRSKGDPTAVQLVEQYPTVRMPNLSLSKDDAADLIGYIDAMTYGVVADAKSPGTLPHDHPADEAGSHAHEHGGANDGGTAAPHHHH